MPDEKIPIILDTDIGSDIDDAVCLAYLLSQPRCELLGVTTVTGEPEKRAMLADAVCRSFGRSDVPVFAGSPTPLLVPQQQREAPQAEVLPKWPHRDKFAPAAAVDFLRETIRARPGEITLLTVGPLTNAGLLFALDRQIPTLLKRYVMMGGVYTTRTPGAGPLEWNTKGDPHASAIVYGACLPGHTGIGLEVTYRCRLPAEKFRQRFSKGALKVVGNMAEVWFRGRPVVTFHDPLAAAVIFEPDLCKYESGLVEVELKSDRVLGMTHFNPRAKEKPHRIAIDVDPDRFFDHYFSATTG